MQYDFNLPANGGSTLDIKGKFFKYKSGTGLLRVRTDKGGFVDLLPGQGVWNVDFSRLMLQDRTGANNAGIILAGDFDFHDDRISGTVDVVDGSKARSLAGNSFVGYCYQGASASNYAQCELFNPAGSGKNCYLWQISVFSQGALAAGVGVRKAVSQFGGSATAGQSKRIGGANSSTLMIPALGPSVSGSAADTFMTLSKSQPLLTFKEPILLTPGLGLFVFGGTAGEDLGVNFEFYEEPQ